MVVIETHGVTTLRDGSVLLETDYQPGDAGPGLLSLRSTDNLTADVVEAQRRLDPWRGNAYPLVESSGCFVIWGGQAIVCVDASSLALRSSIALEYKECARLASPWHAESGDGGLIVATEKRVWCIDGEGSIRWMWSCTVGDEYTWIETRPVVTGKVVNVPVRTYKREEQVALHLGDGLPVPPSLP